MSGLRRKIPLIHLFLIFCLFAFMMSLPAAHAQQTNFGVNLSGGNEPVELNADNLELREKDEMAVFSGNVSVVQGERILKTSKLVVYFNKAKNNSANNAGTNSVAASGIDKMQALGKVYLKNGAEVATADEGYFDGKTNIMTLTGKRVILTDGKNVATGCKLSAHMDSGRAELTSCDKNPNSGRVSIIVEQNDQSTGPTP